MDLTYCSLALLFWGMFLFNILCWWFCSGLILFFDVVLGVQLKEKLNGPWCQDFHRSMCQMSDTVSDAENMDPVWLDLPVHMSDTGSDAENTDPVWLDMPGVCMCVQMSDAGFDAENMDPVWLDVPGVCMCAQMPDMGRDAKSMDPVWLDMLVYVCADVRHWQWCRNYGPSMTWPAWWMCVCADVRHWQWCREHGSSARQYCEGAPQGTGTSPQASPTGQTAEGKVDHSCWGFQAKLTSTEARRDSEWCISCTVGTTCCLKKCIMQQEVTERNQQMRGWG